jgi:hypothetical protein
LASGEINNVLILNMEQGIKNRERKDIQLLRYRTSDKGILQIPTVNQISNLSRFRPINRDSIRDASKKSKTQIKIKN